ncbi:GGDEF domain-containing protein [Aquihabitans sp. McL0605]|uniref:GGDEF domain-containing protein n=1 Tax=Aquihabitans sp. McL0605 TaxID=3415671 RepID=UPI003CF48CF4
MFDRRALPGTIAGFLGLLLAMAAIITKEPVLVVIAGVLTAICVVLVLTLPNRAPVRYKERMDLQEEADKLARENDQMAARAAKFEAEAIAAREKLATAMLAERSQPVGADPSPAVPTPPRDPSDDITDPATGVFTQVFFDASLGKRISAARRGLRPLTVAMMEVVEKVGEPGMVQTTPKPVAEILTETLREADTVARMDSGVFAVLLEDTPENGAIWTLERIRRRISEDLQGCTVRAGMSCYPAYAFDAQQLVDQALGALDAAREWRQDRIEVTTANPDD